MSSEFRQLAPAESDQDDFRKALWPASRPEPVRCVRCRHCGGQNRVLVPRAITAPSRHRCGGCGQSLFLAPDEALADIAAEAYQHPVDRRTVNALRSIPGLPASMRRLLQTAGDRGVHLMFMAEAIQCSERQFPELSGIVDRACAQLDLGFRPTLYLSESPHMNAMSTGVKRPVVVLRSALLDQMNNAELLAVVGHELGHLHADHPLYGSVAQALAQGWNLASPTARALGWPIQRLLLGWLRYAELTADRAALLVSRDLGACVGVMLTFAGGNRPGTSTRTRMRLGPFVEQCRRLSRLQIRHTFDGMFGGYLALGRTHPYLATRVVQLIQWVEHGNYLDIVSGNYLRRSTIEQRRLAP